MRIVCNLFNFFDVGKNKLERFEETFTFKNFFQLTYAEVCNGFALKGKWAEFFFKNDKNIVLELGCGKGEYTTGLAVKYPDKNFIGIDVKGARMWRGAKTSNEENMSNVAFVRSKIQLIERYFDNKEVSEMWITFPDPHPKRITEKKRLTSPDFLSRYKNILKKDHIIHLKTDNIQFFEYTLEVIKTEGHELLFSTHDLYGDGIKEDVVEIQTFYEKMFLKKEMKINYIKFKLNSVSD